MRQAVLLGNPGTKRTDYLWQAAAWAALPVLFVDWKEEREWLERLSEGEWFLKIDPPLWESCSLNELDRLAGDYKKRLEELGRRAMGHNVTFLNHPLAIEALLDKRRCKAGLLRAGLPVTEAMGAGEGEGQEGRVEAGEKMTVEKLLKWMRERRWYQVFIKPVNGSGAAGVSAFRWQPHSGRMALYTCALERPDTGFVNTKRLRRLEDPKEILSLLDKLLALDCVVERWYAKAEYQGFSYDLRVVVQEGNLDFLLARLSKGPITNLHLNNHPMEAAALGLSGPVLDSVEDICKRAVGCFPGLGSAGIDILLEKGSFRPRIIEMNAQGDLIYQDIYGKNAIYGHQAEMMKRWLVS